ncbi:MAG: TPM domain-containing protein [Lachnospiraceae bacterium]|nr:TPM domain-containing protein [Lachnospiraceae bacterium]
MKRKVFPVFFALLLSVISAFPVFAESNVSRLLDEPDLLSESEEIDLESKLDEISERQKVDIVVAAVNSLDGMTAMEYADDFYDYNGYGFGAEKDGILFLISMGERDWYISTTGYGITAITDAGREYISEKFIDDLSAGEYAAAFTTFADLCDEFITQAKTGEPYDVDHMPQEPFDPFAALLAAVFAAFIISLIATGIMRSKLKSVHSQLVADSYVKEGSMKLTKEKDLFLYKKIDRREKPKNEDSKDSSSSGGSGGSKTHTSSSGTTHGGGGGKF